MRPSPEDYIPYYSYYIDLVKEDEINAALDSTGRQIEDFLETVPESKADYAYADGKWTLKQLLGHINDTERIMSYRALRFARGDAQQLPGFEENEYAKNYNVARLSVSDMIHEFIAVRQATKILFKNLSAGELQRKGKTASGEASVLSIGFLICGHALHHITILKERYVENRLS